MQSARNEPNTYPLPTALARIGVRARGHTPYRIHYTSIKGNIVID
jgi:hypothetical protein